jgi:HEAT repeat protein
MLKRSICLVLLLSGTAVAAEFEDLVEKFRSEKGKPYQTRIRTVREIASLGTEEAVEFLVRVIKEDEDRSVQRNAIPQLARIPLPSAFTALREMWRNVRKADRGTVFHALAFSRKEELPAGILKEVLAGSDQSLRSMAVQYLCRRKDPRFADEARRLLKDFPTRGSFLLNLLRTSLSPEVADLVVKVYDDSNIADRERVPAAFRTSTADVKAALVTVIVMAPPVEAGKAVMIAGRAGIPAAEDAMTGRLEDAKAAFRVILLGGISLLGARTPAGRNALLSHLQHRDEQVRIAAARALRQAPLREAIPHLILVLRKAKGALAVEVQVTLERITGQQYGSRADLWVKWWEEYGEKFDPGEVKQRDEAVFDQALVNLAIDKGAAALRKMRGKDRPWTFRGNHVGTTALVLLALPSTTS